MSNIDVSDVHKAPYNPRKMDDESRQALKKSIEEFGEISGIVWNKTTGNLVGGNHRWEELCELYGKENLNFKSIPDTHFHMVMNKEDFTGYLMREVEWSETKEKAANITANSHKLTGVFTEGLQGLLDDIQMDVNFDNELFADLRFEDLSTSMKDFKGVDVDGFNFDEDIKEEENEEENETYTRKVESPIYEPHGEKPELNKIYDNEYTRKLIKDINESDVPKDIKMFLKHAAYRHTKFNYKHIAEYYAHADKEVQQLMEDSALVIIDFEKALEKGFVKLDEEVKKAYLNEK